MAEERKQIVIEVEVDNDAAVKRTATLKKRLEEQKAAAKATQKAIADLDKESQTYAEDLANLNSKLVQQESAIRRTSKELGVQTKIVDAQANSVQALTAQNSRYEALRQRIDQSTERGAKLYAELTRRIDENKQKVKELQNAAKGEISAYKQLSDKLTQMRSEYRDLAATQAQGGKLTKEQVKRMQELEKQIQETDKALKDIDATMGQFPRVVGDYKNAVSQAIQENQGLFGSFGQASGGADDFMGMIGQLGKAFTALLANPVGAVIGILAVLVGAFSQTQAGASKFKEIFGGISAIMNKVIGDLGKLGGVIFKFFEDLASDPVKTLETLGNAIKDNIISRFEGVAKIIPALGEAIANVFKGDFDAAAESAKKLGDAVIQTTTGIEGGTDAIADYGKEMGDAYMAGVNLVKMQKALTEQNRTLTLSVASLTAALQLSRDTMNDATLGWKERNKAANESFANAEKLAVAETRLAENRLAIINAEIDARKSQKLVYDDLKDQQVEAMAGVIAAEANYTQTMRDLGEERRILALDELESRLDVLEDVADANKTISEQQVADTRVGFEERKKILEQAKAMESMDFAERARFLANYDKSMLKSTETRRAMLQSQADDFRSATDQFIAEIEKVEGKEIDLDALRAANSTLEQDRMMRELDLSERAQNRLRGILQASLTAEQDFTAQSIALTDEELATKKAALDKQAADYLAYLQLRTELDANDTLARTELLDAQMAQDLAKYDGNEQMKLAITKKYEKAKAEIQKATLNTQLSATADMLGQAGSLFQEQTIAYKVLMTAQAAINTYTAATAAYASAAAVPTIGYILGPIAAGLAIASGLANIAKINNVKFAKGGRIVGDSHANGGVPFSIGGRVGFEAEGGEYIVNKRSTAASGAAISTINANPSVRYAAVPYASGGALASATSAVASSQNDLNIAAISKQRPVVTVESIRRAEERVDVQSRKSTFGR